MLNNREARRETNTFSVVHIIKSAPSQDPKEICNFHCPRDIFIGLYSLFGGFT